MKMFRSHNRIRMKIIFERAISWYFFLNRKWNRGRTLYSRVTMRFVILIVRISKPFYFVWFGLPSGAARLIDFLHHYWPNSIWICIHIWETSFRRFCNLTHYRQMNTKNIVPKLYSIKLFVCICLIQCSLTCV